MGTNMKDVAKKAGVSTATVSHVINDTRFVKEETRKKVINAMEELDYYPNLAAKSLRSQKSKIIGLLVPDISNFFFTRIAKVIEDIFKAKGYNLIVGNSDENLESEKNQLDVFKAQMIDGLIMAPTGGRSKPYKIIKDDVFPTVYIDRRPKGYQGDFILLNNFKGAYDATTYLINKGHKNIGIITGVPGISTTEERLKGYKVALRDNDIKPCKSLIKIGDSRFESGYKLTKELVVKNNITALFVTNNLMSIGAMEYLNKNGINIPKELAIIGFDDYKWTTITNPPLSVVKQPVDKIGQKATKLLLEKIINNNTKEKNTNVYQLSPELVVRKSC